MINMIETLQAIATALSALLAVITAAGALIKPIRDKIVDAISDRKGRQELLNKIEQLNNSVEELSQKTETQQKKVMSMESFREQRVVELRKNGLLVQIPLDDVRKYVMEQGNTNATLAETATLMTSSDYKERFMAEYMQIKNRYEGLKRMVEKWDAGTLEFTPTCPRATYDFQLKAMKEYKDILEIRAKMEGVKI